MPHHVRHVAIITVLLAAGCQRPSAVPPPAEAKAAAPLAATSVTVVKPERRSLKRTVEQPGTVQAFEEAPLFAKLPGYARRVLVDIGDRVTGPQVSGSGVEVEPGQVLVEIAIPELEEEAKQKHALVTRSEAAVEQAKKALATAEAAVTTAEAQTVEAEAGVLRAQANFDRWESETRRVASMVKGGVVDAQVHDETLNQFRSAEAARAEARAKVVSAKAQTQKAKAERDKAAADVRGAEAGLDVARADARRVDALVGYTKLRAPFDGVVTRRQVDPGHFVQPAGGGSTTALLVVARTDPVRVFVDVPEADAALVRPGAEATVRVQSLGGAAIRGAVARTAWALDPSARTLRTEIDLPNPDGRLRPGMYVQARVAVDLPEAWVLPATALAKQGDAVVCYRVEGGKAVRTPVQTGRSDGTLTEVLKWQKPGAANAWEDFTGRESVAAPAANLTDGQAVPGS
jgi:RND family efflux transporter MFP subunit